MGPTLLAHSFSSLSFSTIRSHPWHEHPQVPHLRTRIPYPENALTAPSRLLRKTGTHRPETHSSRSRTGTRIGAPSSLALAILSASPSNKPDPPRLPFLLPLLLDDSVPIPGMSTFQVSRPAARVRAKMTPYRPNVLVGEPETPQKHDPAPENEVRARGNPLAPVKNRGDEKPHPRTSPS
ncbi:hypothetical protein B0H16DRAFT_1712548 [Mycena metata]|uniref:Uncharacterized protein n=1 Tax=Mycena metata TaxID=1033252 RepID=A0AAD7K175_9AGAR|nr:hypothetical protein B0H16DRAFT_1712548 [Mycena metata]